MGAMDRRIASIGKTAFAVHAARKLMTDFPDGQLFVRSARPISRTTAH